MSQENVEVVRRAFEYFVRTGEQRLDSLDPEVEVYDHDIPDAGTYRGPHGYLRWLSDWGSAWEDFNMEAEQWIDAGDQVVFIFRLTARGRGSGAEVRRRDAMVWTIHDRKATRIDYYNSVSQALQAVNLTE